MDRQCRQARRQIGRRHGRFAQGRWCVRTMLTRRRKDFFTWWGLVDDGGSVPRAPRTDGPAVLRRLRFSESRSPAPPGRVEARVRIRSVGKRERKGKLGKADKAAEQRQRRQREERRTVPPLARLHFPGNGVTTRVRSIHRPLARLGSTWRPRPKICFIEGPDQPPDPVL